MTKGEKSDNCRPFRNAREYYREKEKIDVKYLPEYEKYQEEFLKTRKSSRKWSILFKKWEEEIKQLDARLPRDPDDPDEPIEIVFIAYDKKYLSVFTEGDSLRWLPRWANSEFIQEHLKQRELTKDRRKFLRQHPWVISEKKRHPSRDEKGARKKERLKLKKERKKRELIKNKEPRYCPICGREISKEKRSDAKTCGLFACKKALQQGRIPEKRNKN